MVASKRCAVMGRERFGYVKHITFQVSKCKTKVGVRPVGDLNLGTRQIKSHTQETVVNLLPPSS